MIAWLGAKLGAKLAGPLVILVAIAGLFAVGGLGIWRAAGSFTSAISEAAEAARKSAVKERDAHWLAEIARANLEAEAARRAQSARVAAVNETAQAEISALPIIMPPSTMNSGSGGRTRSKSRPNRRPSNGRGETALPLIAAPGKPGK